jgi:hypothetical protein
VRRLGTLATLLFVAAACNGTTPTSVRPSGSPGASPGASPTLPSPTATDVASGPGSSEPAGSVPATSQPGDSPPPSPASSAEWEVVEREARIFVDDCERLGPDELPARAVAGVECIVDPVSGAGAAGILRAGFYLFRSVGGMEATYRERLGEHGVALDSGDCGSGQPGERRYELADIWDPEALEGLSPEERSRVGRVGCFFDTDGRASMRWTWEDILVYGGLVAGHDDLAETYLQWVDLQQCRSCTPSWGGPVPGP